MLRVVILCFVVGRCETARIAGYNVEGHCTKSESCLRASTKANERNLTAADYYECYDQTSDVTSDAIWGESRSDTTFCPCQDSGSWHKKDDPSKDCSWVNDLAEKRCGVKGTSNIRASYACPAACNTSCSDSLLWYKRDQIEKRCEWVQTLPEKRCSLFNSESIVAACACPTSCPDFVESCQETSLFPTREPTAITTQNLGEGHLLGRGDPTDKKSTTGSKEGSATLAVVIIGIIALFLLSCAMCTVLMKKVCSSSDDEKGAAAAAVGTPEEDKKRMYQTDEDLETSSRGDSASFLALKTPAIIAGIRGTTTKKRQVEYKDDAAAAVTSPLRKKKTSQQQRRLIESMPMKRDDTQDYLNHDHRADDIAYDTDNEPEASRQACDTAEDDDDLSSIDDNDDNKVFPCNNNGGLLFTSSPHNYDRPRMSVDELDFKAHHAQPPPPRTNYVQRYPIQQQTPYTGEVPSQKYHQERSTITTSNPEDQEDIPAPASSPPPHKEIYGFSSRNEAAETPPIKHIYGFDDESNESPLTAVSSTVDGDGIDSDCGMEDDQALFDELYSHDQDNYEIPTSLTLATSVGTNLESIFEECEEDLEDEQQDNFPSDNSTLSFSHNHDLTPTALPQTPIGVATFLSPDDALDVDDLAFDDHFSIKTGTSDDDDEFRLVSANNGSFY